MLWILFSLNAALFFAFRYIVIKKYLSETNTLVTAFITRFWGLLLMLPLLFKFDLIHPTDPRLWSSISLTGILTGLASVLQINAIKKYQISSSLPFLAFVPLFMIPPVYLIFHELPDPKSFIGVLFLSFGAVFIHLEKNQSFFGLLKSTVSNKGGMIFLLVAVIFGITTTVDRIGIDTAGAGGFTYTVCWHIFSSFIFSLIFLDRRKWSYYLSEIQRKKWPLFINSLLGIVAFLSQMYAVELAKSINANVIFVKAITTLQLLIASIIGIRLFNEEKPVQRITGTLLMIVGALIIIFYFR